MSASIVNRNNVLAGFFVLGSLVLAVGIAAVLGDFLGGLGEKNEFVARFPTAVGVTGIQPGAEVSFAGLAVGQVVSVQPYLPEGPDAPPAGMDVLIAIDSRIRLYEDAFADLSPPILGGVSRINFASPGQGRVAPDDKLAELATNDGDGVLDPGEAVRGRFAPSILAQLGFTVEDAEKIRNTIADVEAISATARETAARVDRMAAAFEPKFAAATDEATASVANVRAFTDRLGDDDGWGGRIDAILANAEAATAEAPLIAADFRTAIASTRGLIDTHSASLARVLGNVEATSERVRFETMDQAETLLREGTLAAASFRAAGDEAGAIIANARPEIGVTLANTRSISQQARLFLDEIRAQPWRLLNQPDREDLMREPLYAAARTYAEAVADLRAASEALDAAVQGRGPDGPTADAAMDVARVAASVQAAYDRYAVAERALLEHLRETTP